MCTLKILREKAKQNKAVYENKSASILKTLKNLHERAVSQRKCSSTPEGKPSRAKPLGFNQWLATKG